MFCVCSLVHQHPCPQQHHLWGFISPSVSLPTVSPLFRFIDPSASLFTTAPFVWVHQSISIPAHYSTICVGFSVHQCPCPLQYQQHSWLLKRNPSGESPISYGMSLLHLNLYFNFLVTCFRVKVLHYTSQVYIEILGILPYHPRCKMPYSIGTFFWNCTTKDWFYSLGHIRHAHTLSMSRFINTF